MLVLLALLGVTAGELVNIARNGSISATSVGWGGVPQRAIDGNTDGKWQGRSVYHSAERSGGGKLFLSLPGEEFGAVWPVQSVSVFNRQDACCDDRIQGVQVWVDDYMCGNFTFKEGQHEYKVDCGGRNGSVVTIHNPTTYLQVAELRVFVESSYKPDIPEYVNVARQGEASTTSVGWGGVATRVIDGNTNGYWGGRSCYHSGNANGNRVTVSLPYSDIGIKHPISKIRVYNRMDTCCDQRIQNVQVFADEHMCGQIQFQEGKKAYMFDCGKKNASEVSVRLSSGWLQACELEALVLKEDMPTNIPNYINVALNGTAVATSVAHGGVATRVIDGNRNGYWGGRSCYHSWGGSQHSVTVSLKGGEFGLKYPISFISVYNRLDSCCDQRLNGAMVFAGEHQCGQVKFQEGKSSYKFDCGEKEAGEVSVRLASGQTLQICELEVLVLEENIPNTDNLPTFINVARNATASATSMAHGGVASRVNDGNTNGNWGGRSCYHSNALPNTQHQVTLNLYGGEFGIKYPVSYIKVYNRIDTCCDQRLNGAMVYAGEKQCGQVKFQEGKQAYMFDCGNHTASEVSVKLSGGQSLQICELEVLVLEENIPNTDNIPTFINVARNATAAATSTAHGGIASRVNDGNTNGAWGGRSCYHSNYAANTQHKVTLILPAAEFGVKYPVSYIKVYNRIDTCCDQRLNGAMVYAGEKQCGQIKFVDGKQAYMFNCGNHTASEVSVVLGTGQTLQICELEVLVMEENMPKDIPVFNNVALKRPAAQSSIGWGGVASRAVDGNKNGYWGGRSCTHTSQTKNNWWSVQLAQEDYIQNVVIHNRIDCCGTRLNGAKVSVGKNDEWQECGVVKAEAGSSPVIVMPCNKYGDKVKIANDNSYLTLCEVEVLVPEEVPSEVIDEE